MLAGLWVDHIGWAAGSPTREVACRGEGEKVDKRGRNLSGVIIL